MLCFKDRVMFRPSLISSSPNIDAEHQHLNSQENNLEQLIIPSQSLPQAIPFVNLLQD